MGININTRYAVCRVVQNKNVETLISAFEDLLNKELKNKIRLLIFDGESAISSNEFQNFAKDKFNVKITHSKIHTQTGPIDRLCRTLKHYYMKGYMYEHKEISKMIEKPNLYDDLDLYTNALTIRQIFNGSKKSKIPPVPSSYSKSNKKLVYESIDENPDISHEIYDLVDYYNHKKHNGLVRIFKKASNLFNVKVTKPENEITPHLVHNSPMLEELIMKYCTYYNSFIVKKSPQFKVGDKVKIYDTIEKDGNLFSDKHQFLIGNWVVIKVDNEIYTVINQDGEKRHVSKYMISKS